jgi:hypothetical protein
MGDYSKKAYRTLVKKTKGNREMDLSSNGELLFVLDLQIYNKARK